MEKKAFSRIMLTLLLVGMLTLTFNFTIAELDKTKNNEPVGVTSVSVTQAVDWWPMFQHDERNTGYSTSTGPKTNHVKWTYDVGQARAQSAVVVDGIVYTSASAYYPESWTIVYALNASNGYQIWDYSNIAYRSDTVPAVADGIVYFGVYRTLYALNATNGNIIWTKAIRIFTGDIPIVADGVVYVASDRVFALNATDGSTIWFSNNIIANGVPAVAEGVVYVTSQTRDPTDRAYALNATTGAIIWSYLHRRNSSGLVFCSRL